MWKKKTRDVYNRNGKRKYHIRINIKCVFGFAEHQEKATYGVGYKLTLTRNTDFSVLNNDNAVNNAKIKFNAIEWYVPHFLPSMSSQAMLTIQTLSKTPTELQCLARSAFIKEVNIQNLWTFELGTQERINVRIWVIVGFQQKERQDSQNLNNDSFNRPSVTSAQCNIGTEKYPDSAFSLNYDNDDYSQGYGQIKKLLELSQKTISYNHKYQNLILDHLILVLIVGINYTFPT